MESSDFSGKKGESCTPPCHSLPQDEKQPRCPLLAETGHRGSPRKVFTLDSTTGSSPEEPRLFPLPPPVWLSLLPDAARELLVTGDTPMPQGDRRRAHRMEAESVERVLATYVPEVLSSQPPSLVVEVMRETRVWVAQAGPHDAGSARQMIWAVAPMAGWLLLTSGALDVTMFNPRNVEVWINTFNRHHTRGWRHLARTCLRRVGRAANPDGWPQPKPIGRSPIAQPYLPGIEAAYRQMTELPTQGDRPGRLWVAGGGCGAALNGVELSAAETGDLEAYGNGRLVIEVRGHRPRRVPIRACWTETVRQAARLAQEREGNESSARFIRSRCKNAVSGIAASLDFGQGGLNLRRARTTWLTAHLVAGTPVSDLRVLAGSLSAQTLIELIDLMVDEVDPEQAVIEGLRA